MFHPVLFPSTPFGFDDDDTSPSTYYTTSAAPFAYPVPRSYDAYDARRSHLEQAILARKQQERRRAETAAYLAHQQEQERQRRRRQLEEEEAARRRAAIEEAILREEAARRRKAQEDARFRREYADAIRRREQEREIERRMTEEGATTQAQQQFGSDLFNLLLGGRSQAGRDEPKANTTPRTEEPCGAPDLLRMLFGVPQVATSSRDVPRTEQPEASSAPSPVAPAPASAPASAPVSSSAAPTTAKEQAAESPSSDDEAATTVQRQFRRHLARRNALAKLSSLSSTFADRQSAFEPPTRFVFREPSSSSSNDDKTAAPALAFGSANAAFLSYEDFLVSLLSKIDAVESGGDRQVKRERKALVKTVEKELEKLDAMRQRAWEEQAVEVKNEVETPVQASEPATVQAIDAPTNDATVETEMPELEPLLPSNATDSTETRPPAELTKEALSSLDAPTVDSEASAAMAADSPRPEFDSGSSTTSSTLTISADEDEEGDATMSDLIEQVMKRAEKLRADVEAREDAEKLAMALLPKAGFEPNVESKILSERPEEALEIPKEEFVLV